LEKLDCIFCANSPDEVVICEDGFEGRQCSSCGLIFVSPRPSEEEIATLYTGDRAHVSAGSHLEGYDSWVERATAKHHLAILQTHLRPRKTLLEIGPGSGAFLAEARRQGFEVFGVELNPTQAEFIRTRLGIPCAQSLAELKAATGRDTYDVIYHRDVMSHFFDPIAEFDAMRALLPVGGLVVFETGNIGDIDHRYFHHFSSFQYPDHLFFYSEASLRILLSRTGFDLVEIRRWSILPQLWLIAQLKRLRGKPNASAERSSAEAAGGTMTSRLRSAISYVLYYLARYRVGAVTPKGRRPQTILVVAKKVWVS
jgi:hypothetical protein